MPDQEGKVRVFIATTAGPVEVLVVTEEDPRVGRSVACIGLTAETAGIDAAYNAFVARPTGAIERLFGHPCYRLDVSDPIDAGSSWQLGVLLAHALHAAGRLAQKGEAAEWVVWATGSVRSVDLAVGAVRHVGEKLAVSLQRIEQQAAEGRSVLVAVPAANVAEMPQETRDRLATLGVEAVGISSLEHLWQRLELRSADISTAVSVEPCSAGLTQARRRWKSGGGALVGSVLVASVVPFLSWWDTQLLPKGTLLQRPRLRSPKAPAGTSGTAMSVRRWSLCPRASSQWARQANERGREAVEGPQQLVKHIWQVAIGKFEVTVDEYAAFVQETGFAVGDSCKAYEFATGSPKMRETKASFRLTDFGVTGSHSAVCVNLHEARAYAAWLARKTGKPYRLPSEAVWEYAARAGTTTSYSFGNDETELCANARFADIDSIYPYPWRGTCRSENRVSGSLQVGKLKPNPWGLFDLHGNVWE